MPTYEYRCNACQEEFEYIQKMSDPDLVKCESCGADKLEKLISWTTVRTNNWESALTANNPKEAMKGLHAVDKSKAPKSTKEPRLPPPQTAAAPELAATSPVDAKPDKDEDEDEAATTDDAKT